MMDLEFYTKVEHIENFRSPTNPLTTTALSLLPLSLSDFRSPKNSYPNLSRPFRTRTHTPAAPPPLCGAHPGIGLCGFERSG